MEYNRNSDLEFHRLHQNEIRIILLQPGTFNDPIRCLREHVSLANKPQYKSLSYVWGSTNSPALINLDGQPFYVTLNLASALRRLRDPVNAISIWADALAINQSDDKERANQVSLMRDIYSLAQEVVVYLGEPEQIFQGILGRRTRSSCREEWKASLHMDSRDEQHLDEFRRQIEKYQMAASRRHLKDLNYPFLSFCLLRIMAATGDLGQVFTFHDSLDLDTPLITNIFESIRLIVNSAWWERIWVVQEVVVNKTVTVQCGSVSAPWQMFVEAGSRITSKAVKTALERFPRHHIRVLEGLCDKINSLQQIRTDWRYSGRIIPLSLLLRTFGPRKASDERDRVYALLGLTHVDHEIVPNYSLDMNEVYINAFLSIVDTEFSIEFLAGYLGQKLRKDIPSWIPDWSSPYIEINGRHGRSRMLFKGTNGCKLYIKRRIGTDIKDLPVWRSNLPAFMKKNQVAATLDNQHAPAWLLNDPTCRQYSIHLGTWEWTSLLPDNLRHSPNKDEMLGAIEKYLWKTGVASPIHYHRHGLLEISTFPFDYISVVGEFMAVGSGWISMIQSCLQVCRDYSHDLVTQADSEKSDFPPIRQYTGNGDHGEAFIKMLTAGVDLPTMPVATNQSSRPEFLFRMALHAIIETGYCVPTRDKFGLSGFESFRMATSLGLSADEAFREIANDSEGGKEFIKTVEELVTVALSGRTFFVTRRGYMGHAAGSVRIGDSVHLLPGCDVPLILRDSNFYASVLDEPRFIRSLHLRPHQLIGDCYVDGVMDGELTSQWFDGTKEFVELSSRSYAKLSGEMAYCLAAIRKAAKIGDRQFPREDEIFQETLYRFVSRGTFETSVEETTLLHEALLLFLRRAKRYSISRLVEGASFQPVQEYLTQLQRQPDLAQWFGKFQAIYLT